jgi:aconitate hydratase
MPAVLDPLATRSTLKTRQGRFAYYSLGRLERQGRLALSRLPYSIRILLESVLRQIDGFDVRVQAGTRSASTRSCPWIW